MSEVLAELFSSRVRSAVLTLLLPRPHLAFSLTAMSRRLGLPVSSLQHECYKLARLGLLRDERRGNARLYRPDSAWPLQKPLTALVVGALPLDDALSAAIENISGLDDVWVARDAVSRTPPDFLVVIGALDVETLDGVFDRACIAMSADVACSRVELAYFRPADWARRLATGDAFAASLAEGERVRPQEMGQDVVFGPAIGDESPDVARQSGTRDRPSRRG